MGGANKKYLDDITWYITINANPDGYEFTWDENRMWRKTRNTNTPNNICVGVDPNRNWDNHWNTVRLSKCITKNGETGNFEFFSNFVFEL
jgi:murein tripeptide amidase MpaA